MEKLVLLLCVFYLSQFSCQHGTQIDITFDLLEGEKKIERSYETDVVTHEVTIQKAMDDTGFGDLLMNIEKMIDDFKKFKESLSFVVLKEDNTNVKEDTIVLKPDNSIIKGIANFLSNTGEVYGDDLKKEDIKEKLRKLNINAIEVINILLNEEKEEYTHIMLFKRSDEEDQLIETQLLLDGKEILQQMISENLNFTNTEVMEFGFTISDSSELEINSLVADINDRITESVTVIATLIKFKLENFVEPVRKKIDAGNLETLSQTEAQKFSTGADNDEPILSKAVNYLTHLSDMNDIGSVIAGYLSRLNVEVPASVTETVTKLSKYFQFFQLFHESPLPSLSWTNSFESALSYLTEAKQAVKEKAEYLMEKIDLQISFAVGIFEERIRVIVDKKSLELEIDVVGGELERWLSLFVSIRNGSGSETTLDELTADITLIYAKLNSDDKPIKENLRLLDDSGKFSRILQTLEGEGTIVTAIATWKVCIDNLVEYFEAQVNFNAFVIALYETLSQFDIQKDVGRYDVLDLSDWGEPGHPQGLLVDKSNFKLFMQKVKEFNIEAAEKISNIAPSESQLAILNNVLTTALKKRAVIQCPESPGSTILLKANLIKFSEFLDADNKFKRCGWANIKSLEIYASEAVFIDQDLDALGAKLELSILAPKFEVIGDRIIDLDGKASESLPKALDGVYPSGHGLNGSAGMPGGSAGAFFGVVSSFIASDRLLIKTSGGRGGDGQSGGNGGNGIEGNTPHAPNDGCDTAAYIREGFTIVVDGTWLCNYKECTRYRIYGADSSYGGNGGSCGVGGRGGIAGQNLLIGLQLIESHKFINHHDEGISGAKGVSGVAGSNGQYGADRLLVCRKKVIWTDMLETYLEQRPLPDGVPGGTFESCNSDIPLDPLTPASIESSLVLRNFVKFFIENSNDRFVRHSLSKMYDLVNKNNEVRNIRDTLSLSEDLKMLEFYSANKSLNLIPFYESHLTSIENYAANPKENERSAEFKKVLSYLYTASLTKISNLKGNQDSDLVIDISWYLDIVSQNVKTLSSLQDESRLVSTVETLKNNFKNEIDKKIEEANYLIANAVTPEFDKISTRFDEEKSRLINEVTALQNAEKAEKAALEARKKELRNSMSNAALLQVLGFVTKVISLLGPIGSAVGTGLTIGTSVATSLIQGEAKKVPPSEIGTLTAHYEAMGNTLLGLSSSSVSNLNDMREVTQGIENVEKNIKKLEEFKKRIYSQLIPLIAKMGNDLINKAKNLGSQSSIFLDIISWQVQGIIRDTSLEIQKFTRGFDVHDSVIQTVEKLEEVMTILIKVHDRIQGYQEQQKLATYMADLSSASAKQIVVLNPLVSNSFRDLQISIRSNILLNQYNSVLNAFKQWIFPFAEIFLKDFYLPEHLVSSNTDIEALASTAASRIEDIRSRIQKYKTTIEDFDTHINVAQFNGSSAVMKPFYVWRNEEHRDIITKLLAGESILVKADITESAADKDAIKFSFVEFGLKSDDPVIQAEVDRTLLNYVVNMTHLGISYYRYNGEYFSITSPSQSMLYSVEKGTIQNNVYKKLLSGDIILSPYAMWELSLTMDSLKSASTPLKDFSDKVDLVLEGGGNFVTAGATNFDVDSYYKTGFAIKLTNG